MTAGKALAVHLHLPGGDQPRLPFDALHSESFIALYRIVGFDLLDDAGDPLHHGGEIGAGLAWAKAQLTGPALLGGKAGASDQRLGGDAAAVEAIAAHLVLLDERHLGLHRCGDIAGHEAAGSGANYQQVVVIAGRFAVGGVQSMQGEAPLQTLEQHRHQPEQGQCHHQAGGEDIAGAGEVGKLAACQHVDEGAGQHAKLAHPVVGADSDGSEPHQQVDQKEGEDGYEAQAQQIKRPFLLHTGLQAGQLVTKAPLDPVAQQKAGTEKGQGRANAAGKGDQQQSPDNAEHGAAGQGEQAGARQGEAVLTT